ncbi:MAG: tRNA (adenosine(37)-N6)-threonylcarbamoyltransferase complex ATPase subunit type 1 TsaE [Thermomicrobiales bacterium]|nr:tRNA (adenosine(37)-N6)-threonylcarbamoyltransferase complex ATPase subunit type 1 TsaE [Thermomicrobiales bacterium]
MNAIEVVTQSPEETRKLGERVGCVLADGAVLLLNGDLGAGKTTLTQGIAAGFGVREAVQSPTFTLVAEHEGAGGRRLHHLDLYRLQDESDLESFGYEQYIDPVDGISIIEWPERAGSWLPESFLLIDIAIAGPSERRLRLEAHGGFSRELSVLGAASDS